MPDIEVPYEGIVALSFNSEHYKSIGPDRIVTNAYLRRYSEWVGHYIETIFKASPA